MLPGLFRHQACWKGSAIILMANKAYSSSSSRSLGVVHTVIASTVEIHDEHLIFCNAKGELAACFYWRLSKAGDEMSDEGAQ